MLKLQLLRMSGSLEEPQVPKLKKLSRMLSSLENDYDWDHVWGQDKDTDEDEEERGEVGTDKPNVSSVSISKSKKDEPDDLTKTMENLRRFARQQKEVQR